MKQKKSKALKKEHFCLQGRAGQHGPPGGFGVPVGPATDFYYGFKNVFLFVVCAVMQLLCVLRWQGLKGPPGTEGAEGKPGTQVPIL